MITRILIDRGEVFDGTWDQFQDCFGYMPKGSNPIYHISSFAEPNGWEWSYYVGGEYDVKDR